MTKDQEIGVRLREFRHRHSLSQTAAGALIGVSFQQWQKHEKGVNRLSCSALLTICEKMNVSPAEILPWPKGGDYLAGVADGKREGIAEGMSRVLARIQPVMDEARRQAYQIEPDKQALEPVVFKLRK